MKKDGFSRVAVHQSRSLTAIKKTRSETRGKLNDSIRQAESILEELNKPLPSYSQKAKMTCYEPPPKLRTWEEIFFEAQNQVEENFDICDVFNSEEIKNIVKDHKQLELEFERFNSLDKYDFILSGTAGVLAGLIDIFLVQIPKYNIGPYSSEGGGLSNLVNEHFGKVLDKEKIKELEELYKVPYDTSSNAGLNQKVAGLGPHTHRFHSFGHDPLLGFIFGIKDLLLGEFTAVDKYGKLVVQGTSKHPFMEGENIFLRIFKSLQVVIGHYASDVATKKGLPAPLMPLLQFLQTGTIGNGKYTISDMARQMYYKGYDFRHFIASSLQVLLIEAIIRIGFFARSIYQGKSLSYSVPFGSNHKLRSQLFLAHTVAVSMNIGKIAVTQNPLSLNWAQWLAFFRYLIPHAAWILWKKENARHNFIIDRLEQDRQNLFVQVNNTWNVFYPSYNKAII